MKDIDKQEIGLEQVIIDNERFFKISNNNWMKPFFMNIVSDSNHWMFISSNGGLSAGRKESNYALFPYYTDDKITEGAENTGSKSIFWVHTENRKKLWEPFSNRQAGTYDVTRNVYKSIYGNKVRFEEINHDLDLRYSYQWSNSNQFGFIRKSIIENLTNSEVRIELLDGLQNIMPASVPSDLQNSTSNLVDAYKRTEVDADSGLAMFALSAIIVDKAEPSESLKANIAWSLGIDKAHYLLSSQQLNRFRRGVEVQEEIDVKAERGGYFINSSIELGASETKEWKIILDVNKSQSDIVKLIEIIKNHDSLDSDIAEDIELGTFRLIKFVASSDGLQMSADKFRDARHYSNVLFNIMRGGIFDENYKIDKSDFLSYLNNANKTFFSANQTLLGSLKESFTLTDLQILISGSTNIDFKRLAIEYLPLKFSRRHGDPSRPWNKFSINTRSEIDGSKILDYEGNWRDIFQNWEALVYAFPGFIEGMVFKFLNATTFDGYNPYRVTKGGFDWETIEPDDPWSYIGYWGDHQIIYLLKLLEIAEDHFPGKLLEYCSSDLFVYANVPYQIKEYKEILKNPKDTIDFNTEADEKIRALRNENGADGALLTDETGAIHRVNFLEKILATTLSKISNFIPEGGIWMNTQRPEWNDANNALVGNGVSMVTLYYLRRFLKFFSELLEGASFERVKLSNELVDFYKSLRVVLEENESKLSWVIDDKDRKSILDGLGQAASDYRWHVYNQGFWGTKRSVSKEGLQRFFSLVLKYIDHTIEANRRTDKLYHAYNLMTVENDKNVSVSHLSEMLEGQVAVLSSGYLSPKQSLEVLDGLKNSSLFREDQYSYILYPNKNLARFLQKNTLDKSTIERSILLTAMSLNNENEIVVQDVKGQFHFNSNFRNAKDLETALERLALNKAKYTELVSKEKTLILNIFEETFNHKEFTGRSGTFFGYEGLGSIYWHMVSKLLLATQESCLIAIEKGADDETVGRLLEHYYEINEGIGVHKSPELYGAFPTDPYSHTPANRGAQQPGMTGQVKEDILCRFGELGVSVFEGQIQFKPSLLRKTEFLSKDKVFKYVDVNFNKQSLQLNEGYLAFTYCQIPVVYKLGMTNGMTLKMKDGEEVHLSTTSLDSKTSAEIFARRSSVLKITVEVTEDILK